MSYGKLYLIPSPLGEGDPREVLPASLLELLPRLNRFVVEEVRTARRFLSAAGLKGHIQELEFATLNEHTPENETEGLLKLFEDGNDVGLISEAGLPAVADPGARLVALCHRKGIEVVPFAGPSSLMMALMSSGLDGQHFSFNGYIPAKADERKQALKDIERLSRKGAQIMIETPYRNDSLLADMLSILNPSTMLCIARDITCPGQFIKTMSIGQWKKQEGLCIGKHPCVFIIQAR